MLAAPVTTQAAPIIPPVIPPAVPVVPVVPVEPTVPATPVTPVTPVQPVTTSPPVVPTQPVTPATTIPPPNIPPATPGVQNTFIPQIPPIIPPPTAPITPGAPPAPVTPVVPAPVPSNIPAPVVPNIPVNPVPVPVPAVPVNPVPVPVPVPVPPVGGGWVPIVPTPFPTPPVSGGGGGFLPVPVPVNPVNPGNPAGPAPTMPRLTTPPPSPFMPGAYGQMCPNSQYSAYAKCADTSAVATDGGNGRLYCNQFDADCCRCASIQCGAGTFGAPCTEFYVGNSGALGVQDIVVAGDVNDGAVVSCYGTQACMNARLTGSNIESVDCKGDESCSGATVLITDPYSEFRLYCSGVRSCQGLQIKVDFTGPPPGYMCAADATPNGVKDILQLGTIECLNEDACSNMEFVLDNTGCYFVTLRKLQCVHPTACTAANFAFIGDVDIQSCELGQSGASASGLGKCYQNLREYDCSSPQGCLGLEKTIVNPANGFEFKCGNVQSCEAANVRFEFDRAVAEPIEQINGLVFGGRNSARGATFTFANAQGMDPFTGTQVIVDVDKIDCSGEASCQGARFITGPNVQINEITCSNNACLNCRVQFGPLDAGQPCDASQVGWQQQQPQQGPWVQI